MEAVRMGAVRPAYYAAVMSAPVAGVHVSLSSRKKAWMAGTSLTIPAMTRPRIAAACLKRGANLDPVSRH
jgi:hypothetical protein